MADQNNHIQHEDFIIRVRPTFTGRGSWTGDAEVSIITSKDSKLDEEVFAGMEMFVMMLLSSLPVMEEDEYVREKIYSYVNEHHENYFTPHEPSEDTEVLIESSDTDNVIRLSFSTKTSGEA